MLFGKIPGSSERQAPVWDSERDVPSGGLPSAWQTDTCLGDWRHQRSLYDWSGYKSAETVTQDARRHRQQERQPAPQRPLRGDGSPDEKELKIIEGITAWMDVNKEAIFDTRPWVIFGEGPASDGATLSGQGFNEGKGRPLTAQDVRFTSKGGALYAILLDWPGGQAVTSRRSRKTLRIGRRGSGSPADRCSARRTGWSGRRTPRDSRRSRLPGHRATVRSC